MGKFNREAMLKQVFAKMDADGDGTVDVEEMKRTAKSAKEAEELPLLFHFFDQNADGKLTYDEWVVGINQIAPDDASLERELKDILQVLEDGAMAATMEANAENPADDLDNMDDLDDALMEDLPYPDGLYDPATRRAFALAMYRPPRT